MTKILAIETSTSACSVALLINQEIHEIFSEIPQQHTKLLLPMIQQLLTDKKLKLAQLDAIAFSKGPGSFTGIRIAAGIMQGLSLPTSIPIVPISSLQTLAQTTLRIKQETHVLASFNAHRGEVYWGAYKFAENALITDIPDQLCRPNEITLPNGLDWFGVGDAWQIYPDVFKKQLLGKLKGYDATLVPHAQDVAQLASYALEHGEFVTAEQALPVYLRGKETWRKQQ
jgi:tRNA threonylcarbamoyladenosine biosynthesis protein TsaB